MGVATERGIGDMDWWRVVRVLMIISAGVLAHIAIIQREKIAIMRRDLKIALKAYNILWKMYHEKIEQERESKEDTQQEEETFHPDEVYTMDDEDWMR